MKVTGYALLFGVMSEDLGGFQEIIQSDALDNVFPKQDVLALLNHDENRGVLARYTNGKGTLTLTKDSRGLRYTFDVPDTQAGSELVVGIQRGDIRASSFGFYVSDGQRWEKRGDEFIRTITRFDKIFDVSPVYRPAYIDTYVKLEGF